MRAYRKYLLVVALASLSVLTQCSLLSQKPVRVEPLARWESVHFKFIDKVSSLSEMEPLREKRLKTEDFEIRIWRGFGLSNLEMVSIRYSDGRWSGSHVTGNDYFEITAANGAQLPAPKEGWGQFEKEISRLGLFSLATSYDDSCWAGMDGTTHVVEISRAGIYRTFAYQSDSPNCPASRTMDLIAEFIAIEFDDGTRDCRTSEWLPCGKVMRERRLREEAGSK